MRLPEWAIPLYLRATGQNRVFRSPERARAHVDSLALRPRPYAPPRRLGYPVTIDVSHHDGWPVYRVRPTAAPPQGAVVYAHGGGWVHEISAPHWQLVAQIAAKAQTTVVLPIYPLVPFGTADTVVTAVVDLVRETRRAPGSPDAPAGNNPLCHGGAQPLLLSTAEDYEMFGGRNVKWSRRNSWLRTRVLAGVINEYRYAA